MTSGAGYASQNEQRVHIGLGDAAKIDNLEIIWANGQTERFVVNKINAQITINQNTNTSK